MVKLQIDFGTAVSQFEREIKKFQVRKIIYQTVFRGKGLEFDSYRYFNNDEDASMIDWKASLRANRLLAKSYIEERNLNIYFVVDASNSMLFGSGKKLKAEYAGEIVAALSHLITSSGDNAGLIMINDKQVRVLKAGRSRNQFYLFLNSLSNLDNYKGGFSLKNVINYLLGSLEANATVVLVSDFINYSGGLDKELKLLATKFETLALMVRDPFDDQLPNTHYQMVIQDPQTKSQMIVDPFFAAGPYKKNALEQKGSIKKLFFESGIDLIDLSTDVSFINPIISFFRRRAGGI